MCEMKKKWLQKFYRHLSFFKIIYSTVIRTVSIDKDKQQKRQTVRQTNEFVGIKLYMRKIIVYTIHV